VLYYIFADELGLLVYPPMHLPVYGISSIYMLECVSDVMELLTVWWRNDPKTRGKTLNQS